MSSRGITIHFDPDFDSFHCPVLNRLFSDRVSSVHIHPSSVSNSLPFRGSSPELPIKCPCDDSRCSVIDKVTDNDVSIIHICIGIPSRGLNEFVDSFHQESNVHSIFSRYGGQVVASESRIGKTDYLFW